MPFLVPGTFEPRISDSLHILSPIQCLTTLTPLPHTRPVLLTESDDEATDEEDQALVAAMKAQNYASQMAAIQQSQRLRGLGPRQRADKDGSSQSPSQSTSSASTAASLSGIAKLTLTTTSSSPNEMNKASPLKPPLPIVSPMQGQDLLEIDLGGEEDDSEITRLLMQRAEQMRERLLAPQEAVAEAIQVDLQSSSTKPQAEIRPQLVTQEAIFNPEEDCTMLERVEVALDARQRKAAAYLESLIISFLTQIHRSTVALNSPSKLKHMKSAGGKRKFNESDEEAEGSDSGAEGSSEGEDGEAKQQVMGRKEPGIEMKLKNRQTGNDQVISFPDHPLASKKKENSLQRMACILRVASLLYDAIYTDCITTKRDIYYKDVGLFNTQSKVDKLVDDIVASAGLKRQDFNVCATSKGLIASNALQITMKSGDVLSLSSTTASLIPPIERVAQVEEKSRLDWVLIVEKDAIFQTLCSARLLEDCRMRSGAIVTAKGYPDLATLQLLSKISITCPTVKVFALVDADPHGLDILSVYTNGSRSTLHSQDHRDVALGDKLKWIGVKTSELSSYGIKKDDLLPLTEKDVQKANAMLRRDLPTEWKRELSYMLHLNRKAEIEILCSAQQPSSGNMPSSDIFGENVGGVVTGPREQEGTSLLVEYVVQKVLQDE